MKRLSLFGLSIATYCMLGMATCGHPPTMEEWLDQNCPRILADPATPGNNPTVVRCLNRLHNIER